LNLRIVGTFSDTRTQILHVRSDREIRNRAWPDLRVSWTDVALPPVFERYLASLSLSSGFRKTRLETTFGRQSLQRRATEEIQVPLEMSATWAGEVTTRYRGSFSDGEGRDPTGDTRINRQNHAFLLSAALAEPPLLAERLDGPLRVSVNFQYSSESNCRVPRGLSNCVPFVDYLNRSLSLTLDTVLSPMEVGLHLTYTNRESFVGRHDGSTQFQLGFFGQFLFDSGSFVPPTGASPVQGF
jgi:hypothetical protein